MRSLYKLSDREVDLLRKGRNDPDIITRYFFKSSGNPDGFILDRNFDEEGKWQKAVHLAYQNDIFVVGGFGSGKTIGIGISAVVHCISTPDFKFLNAGPQSKHAYQMYYKLLQEWIPGTVLEKMLFKYRESPTPQIVWKFKIGNVILQSQMDFMSVAENAKGILSYEGDWANLEEAGLESDTKLEEIYTNLGTRVRGHVRGRPRLGRISMITNSWYNNTFWYYFDMAEGDPQNYLSLTVSMEANHNLTSRQIADMKRRVPKDEWEQKIHGLRPEGKGAYFSRASIDQCQSLALAELAEDKVKKEIRGWRVNTVKGVGVYEYVSETGGRAVNLLLADPGTGRAPYRNAPCIGVWNSYEFPHVPATLVGFWWGNGNGSIKPFINKLHEFQTIFKPHFVGLDSTGPQSQLAQTLNLDVFKTPGLPVPLLGGRIQGVDFSGGKKSSYLLALMVFLDNGFMVWPKNIVGIRAQLANYDPLEDRLRSGLAQDIVSMMAMTAGVLRRLYYADLEPKDKMARLEDDGSRVTRETRLVAAERERRLAR